MVATWNTEESKKYFLGIEFQQGYPGMLKVKS